MHKKRTINLVFTIITMTLMLVQLSILCAATPIQSDTQAEPANTPETTPNNLPLPNPEKAVVAVSRFGIPMYSHMTLVNPYAPKGGTLRLATVGTFDGVNDKIVKGIAATGIGLTIETLMARSPAEPFAMYGLVAEKIEIADDKSYVVFYLNPYAKFSNGDPVTADDVKFTMETLRDKGLPRYKNAYGKIVNVIIHSPQIIQFHLKPADNGIYDAELPLALSNMCVLSKKQLETLDFPNSGLTPLIGTGPYVIEEVQQGRLIAFKRNTNYWGAALPLMIGQFNFDKIRIEYFKNVTTHFQGFLAKAFDVIFDTNPQQWDNGYNVDSVKNGAIIREDTEQHRPVSVRTIIMNMRRPIFQNIELRRALVLAFDADSLNRMVFDGVMKIPHSLFANTPLAHEGAATGLERDILLRHASNIEPNLLQRMLAGSFEPARTASNGDQRENLLKAAAILDAAGYKTRNGQCCAPDGTPVVLTLMLKDEKLEKIALMFRQSLQKIGITLNLRKLDANSYENRVVESDFDMIIHTWSNSAAPGIEQAYYFGVKTADMKGSSNYIGLKDPIAEELAKEIARAVDLDGLKAAVSALDRYVMHLCLQIPLSYDNSLRFAYWKDALAIPETKPEYDVNVMNRGWDPKLTPIAMNPILNGASLVSDAAAGS